MRGTVELVVVVELEVSLRPKGIWSSPTVRGVSSGDTPQAQRTGAHHADDAAHGERLTESVGRFHPAAHARTAGSDTTKRAPPPRRSSTQARPPMAVACSLTSASPNPVPTRRRASVPR